jgi:hypothetical protein
MFCFQALPIEVADRTTLPILEYCSYLGGIGSAAPSSFIRMASFFTSPPFVAHIVVWKLHFQMSLTPESRHACLSLQLERIFEAYALLRQDFSLPTPGGRPAVSSRGSRTTVLDAYGLIDRGLACEVVFILRCIHKPPPSGSTGDHTIQQFTYW